ncbi:MAG: serine hydrolase domain-containing protein [Fodinibius sp.]|nr:serine hydrolase domain-containing protein [Fodinibius sp.]
MIQQSRFYGAIRQDIDTLQTIDNADRVFENRVDRAEFLPRPCWQDRARCGIVALDDPIQQYLDFSLNDSLQVSISDDLANHTSGMPRVPSGFIWEALWHMDNPYKDYDEQKLRTYLSTYIAIEAEPGTEHQYSNIGAGTLGYVLTLLTGNSYGEMLHERIFNPSGDESHLLLIDLK